MTHRPPRILFVAHTAEMGGPTHSLWLLLRHLRQRFEVAVLVAQNGPLVRLLQREGLRYFTIPDLRFNSIFAVAGLLRREGFDLVYGNNPSRRSRNALVAAKLAGKPFIWHFRGMKWHWTWREGIFLRGADAVVAVSQACADSLARFYPRPNIRVIYNGVDVEQFDDDRASARHELTQKLGLGSDAHVVASISHLIPRKGHENAVAVMHRVIADQPEAHLLIAGALDRSPAYTERVRTLIARHGLDHRIHLLGLRPDVPRILRGSDLLLHTAFQDPHPRSVIEAMAAALPVVAFCVDGVAETVVPDVTGCLVEPGDVNGLASATLRLLRQPDQARAMGEQGRVRVETHFTAARTAEQIAGIIDRLA